MISEVLCSIVVFSVLKFVLILVMVGGMCISVGVMVVLKGVIVVLKWVVIWVCVVSVFCICVGDSVFVNWMCDRICGLFVVFSVVRCEV